MRLTTLFKSLGVFIFIFLMSCQAEKENKIIDVLGRWEIQQAIRNGQPTTSLAELYFEFFENGKMRTNLSGSTREANFSLEDNKVLQRGEEMDIDYEIQSISDSSLVLSTQIRNIPFLFSLRKRIQEE